MNQTEAFETVLEAALQTGKRTNLINIDGEYRDLDKALSKVTPKIRAMRKRLDNLRALHAKRKRIAAGMPPWLERATR